MAIMETSELYKTGTELKMNLQTRYEKESALPENRNDPHFGDRFMAEVGPQLDQWGKRRKDRSRQAACGHAQGEHPQRDIQPRRRRPVGDGRGARPGQRHPDHELAWVRADYRPFGATSTRRWGPPRTRSRA
jgi:hypothetical protein